MCGQIAYDWKTMPRPRSFAGTRIRCSDESRTRSRIRISPPSGVSRPAMERSVVVLPQPEGPRSVKSSPSASLKLTSSTARTRPVRSPRPGGNVFTSCVIVSTGSTLPDADLGAKLVRDRNEEDECADHHHPEGRELRKLAVLPLLPDHDRQDLLPR